MKMYTSRNIPNKLIEVASEPLFTTLNIDIKKKQQQQSIAIGIVSDVFKISSYTNMRSLIL